MRWSTLVVAAALVVASCTGSDGSEPPPSDPTPTTHSGPTTTAPTDDPLVVDPSSHTVAALRSLADYEQLAVDGIGGQAVLKFSITEFSTAPEIVWLDPSFYTLHDEWYWFQLLNGVTVRGFDTAPVADGPGFATVEEVYEWAAERREALPLDLRFTSQDRLYSPTFYDVALDADAGRRIGLGALLRVPDRDDGDDHWIIELEFSDAVTLDQVETYFDVVASSVPAEIGDALRWVPRSRAQELVAAELGADRVVTYDELAEPGETQVYAPGIAAGRLLLVTDGGRWSLSDAGPDDIVAIESAPDDLPPGNGLITGTPQTPLAHVNVLALNRRIPNASLQGLADDPTLSQLGRVRAPVLISATADGELRVIPLTDDEFDQWRRLRGTAPVAVDAVDRTTLPFTRRIDDIDTSISATELDWLKPAIGGKAAGFVELATPGTVTMPLDPTVVTVRAYLDHADGFADEIDALVAHARDPESSVRSRFLLLEGRADYDERFTSDDDRSFADEFVAGLDGTLDRTLARVVAADGFRRMFRDRPIDPANLARITDELAANFAGHAPEQGLRFRSSSSVEDIEGFNGAGLYDSNTGFLDPTVLPDPDDHDRTIERAILRTWSSYWSATAFEERERENVEHASGAMAVLVHARFDDPLELANGVAVFTVAPDPDTASAMVLNTQLGDTSVTNAENADRLQPEVVSVTAGVPDGAPVIERRGPSTLSPDADVLDDDAVIDLFEQLRVVADSWLERENRDLPAAQHRSTLTLDVEYRLMDAGWPALADGTTMPSRMVVKQARTLDPGLRAVPAELLDLPIPRDVLAHAASVVEFDCTPPGGDPSLWYAVTTDPLAPVDLGYSERPLVVPASDGVARDENGFVGCPETEVLATPQQYLHDLLATR